MTSNRKITDDEILEILREEGRAMTSVIRSMLGRYGYRLYTDTVLRRLKRLEREGKVERAPSVYKVQLCWRLK